MKRVCLLIYDLRSGGAEKVISQWSTLLSDNYQVYMTLFDKDAEIAYPYSGELVYLEGKADNRNTITKVLTVLKRARSLEKFVKKNKIDIVISFCNECNLVNTISKHKAEKICSIRSASDLNANRFVKFVIQSENNKIIVQTDALKKSMNKHYGLAIEKKLIVFGNPFNSDEIRRLAKEEPPSELGYILDGKKTVVSVASFKPQKNHANLLRSFELLADKMDDVYLLLIGADSTGLKSKVEDMAKKSKHRNRIIFIGELRNPYSVVSRASLFVLPSLAEGIPNVLAEALICGTPAVACNCPTGPAELLCESPEEVSYDVNGKYIADYGILVKPFTKPCDYDYSDMEDGNVIFASAMEYALSSEEVIEDLHHRAIFGAERFDIEKYKKELVKLVESF